MERIIFVNDEPSDADYAEGLYAIYPTDDAIKQEMIKSGTNSMRVGVYQLIKVLQYSLEMEPRVSVAEIPQLPENNYNG